MSIMKIRMVEATHFSNDRGASKGIRVGMPFLVDQDTGEIIEPVLIFLSEQKAHCDNTEDARCNDLKDWFYFLNVFNLNWLEVEEEDVLKYIRIMQETYSSLGLPYAKTTIKRRVATITKFYGFWKYKKLYKGVIENYRVGKYHNIESNFLPHLGSHQKKTSNIREAIKLDDRRIDVMTPSVWQAIKAELPSTSQLIWEAALLTGMRISEVLSLNVKQILSMKYGDDTPKLSEEIKIKGKGNVIRSVYFPHWFLKSLHDYVEGERSRIIIACKRRRPTYKTTDKLFINSESCSAFGKSTTVRTAERHFSNAVQKNGYVLSVWRTNLTTGERYESEKNKYCGHCTRHTFAVWLYYSRKEQGDAEPWKYIQARLGHKHLQTTIDTYLRAVSLYEHEVSDRLYNNRKSKVR